MGLAKASARDMARSIGGNIAQQVGQVRAHCAPDSQRRSAVVRGLPTALGGKAMSHPLFELVSSLERSRIHFTLQRHRPDTILVTITFVGERVEVDVFEDGHMEVSRFKGCESIVGGQDLVYELIKADS